MQAEITSRGASISASFDEEDERALPPAGTRVLRAAGVAAVWAVSALPIALGWQGCTMARLLHRPCPGCGMTRALHLLVDGHVGASLRMHPLAVPLLVVGLLFMASTVWVTYVFGAPVPLHRSRFARTTIGLAIVVYGAALVLWILRWLGYFGGPVPVD